MLWDLTEFLLRPPAVCPVPGPWLPGLVTATDQSDNKVKEMGVCFISAAHFRRQAELRVSLPWFS